MKYLKCVSKYKYTKVLTLGDTKYGKEDTEYGRGYRIWQPPCHTLYPHTLCGNPPCHILYPHTLYVGYIIWRYNGNKNSPSMSLAVQVDINKNI